MKQRKNNIFTEFNDFQEGEVGFVVTMGLTWDKYNPNVQAIRVEKVGRKYITLRNGERFTPFVEELLTSTTNDERILFSNKEQAERFVESTFDSFLAIMKEQEPEDNYNRVFEYV